MSAGTQNALADSDEKSMAEVGAMDWHIRLMSGSASRREVAQFERWLGESPANAKAYARLVDIWDEMELLSDASVVREGLTVPAHEESSTQVAFMRSPLSAISAMAAAVCAVVVVTISVQYPYSDDDIYRTAVGQREVVELPDGSIIMLNTASAVDVDFADDGRRVTLLDGQASFKVAKDAERPFIVFAGEGSIRALGTEFDVYKSPDGVRVTLIEGRVRVASAEASGDLSASPLSGVVDHGPPPLTQVDLSPGEQAAIASIGAVSAVEEVDVERIVAWREGKVNFRNTPLVEAIAEMNRYSEVQIRLADGGELDDLRVSGVFRVNNSDHFVNALESLFGIEAKREARGGVRLVKPA